jgi:hypothetical protein
MPLTLEPSALCEMMIRDRRYDADIKRGSHRITNMDLNDMPVKNERLVFDEPFLKVEVPDDGKI